MSPVARKIYRVIILRVPLDTFHFAVYILYAVGLLLWTPGFSILKTRKGFRGSESRSFSFARPERVFEGSPLFKKSGVIFEEPFLLRKFLPDSRKRLWAKPTEIEMS